MNRNKATIIVAGNATLDAIVDGDVSIEGEDILYVNSRGKIEAFTIEDPPIRPGFKHRVNQDISEKVMRLWHSYEPGGGGYNSVTSIQNLPEMEAELRLIYMDVSTPHPLIYHSLDDRNIEPVFFFQRDVPVNAILGWRSDKIILKGSQLVRVNPDYRKKAKVKSYVKSADSILLNSLKDPGYAEEFVRASKEHEVPAYAVVTTSLDPEFVFGFMLPNVRSSILNYDEIPALNCINHELDEQSKLQLALETLRQIRTDGTNSKHPIYVTLGKNGAYCARKSSIDHVFLKHEFSEEVNASLSSGAAKINGAGDVFAAALTAYDTLSNREIPINELLKRASIAAIRHIGYRGPLPISAFEHNTYEIEKPKVASLQ